jgi:hypothetical protein
MAYSEEKPGVLVIDDVDSKTADQPKVDYSGACEKTNPEEIKLVKKLDRWIMVCGFAFFFLLSRVAVSNITLSRNSQCYGACSGSTILTETPLPWLDLTTLKRIST